MFTVSALDNLYVWNISIFSVITPCSPLEVDLSFGGICSLFFHGVGGDIFETSIDFQRAKRLYVSEDRTLLNYWSENLKFKIMTSGLCTRLLGASILPSIQKALCSIPIVVNNIII
jgi:hypothetical protein